MNAKNCPMCKGYGVIVKDPLVAKVIDLMDPDMASEWYVDCPECGGEGLVPIDHTPRYYGNDHIWADISWDWPEGEPSDLEKWLNEVSPEDEK